MTRPRANEETGRTARQAVTDGADQADESGWPGEVDDPRDAPPPPTPDPPPAGRPPAPPVDAGGGGPRALSPVEHNAAHLHETSSDSYLYCSMAQVFRSIGPPSFKLYLAQTLEAAGDPTDPIERMLIEQICLSHHNIGRLHVKAAGADHLESERVYIGAAALLLGEFRRSVAALKSYREPSKAAGATADAAPSDRPGVAAGRASDARREPPAGEQGSNPAPGATSHDATTIPFAAQPEAGVGRPEERPEAEGADPRRARKAPRRGLG